MLSTSFSGGHVAPRSWGMSVACWPAERLKAKWADGKKNLGVKSLKTWIWKSNFKIGKPRKLHTNRYGNKW